MMKTETEKIITLLKRTYEAGAWHGPSVKEALNGIDGEIAKKKLPNTHCIIELVGHVIAWRQYVLERLAGNNSFVVSDEMNFPKREDWETLLNELDESQKELLDAVQKFPVYKLAELVPLSEQNYTYYTLLNGIIHHDLYHAGQIMLIRRTFGY
jgi:uncharacterized damage-inducible protein DinB